MAAGVLFVAPIAHAGLSILGVEFLPAALAGALPAQLFLNYVSELAL